MIETHRVVAEAGWRWVLDQVHRDDGPWIPVSVTVGGIAEEEPPPPLLRSGTYDGTGGLAHALAEIRLLRPWTEEEATLADAILNDIRARLPEKTDVSLFDGLTSDIGVLVALDPERVEDAVEQAVFRTIALATSDGWSQDFTGPPSYEAGARVNDTTLGTAGVLLGAVWAMNHHVDAARVLAERATEVLLAEAESVQSAGASAPGASDNPQLNWRFVPRRFLVDQKSEMPNWSHGLAGVAAALAVAGRALQRRDLVDAAVSAAEHLVTLGDTTGDGFAVDMTIPNQPDRARIAYGWCHGPTGTSQLFAALRFAGVPSVAGRPPDDWERRCLHSVRTSGIPERRSPGFWDNDGRCCGTAGVGDRFLDAWSATRTEDYLAFAARLADTLVDNAIWEGPHAYWRFLEHRSQEPLLPPRVGWMQGAAGIAAYLFRVTRVLDAAGEGADVECLPRMDTWWCQV